MVIKKYSYRFSRTFFSLLLLFWWSYLSFCLHALLQFDLALHSYQLYEWETNYLVRLNERIKLNKEDFIIALTRVDAARLITKDPVFPCLNHP